MPNQPTSFRFPFSIEGKADEQVVAAVRYAFTGLKDVNDAIVALNDKANTNANNITSVTNQINEVVQAGGGGGGGGGTTPFAGGNVNLQPNTTPGAYTLAQSDFAGLILVQSTIPFALTLNNGLLTPFFTTVYNLGSANITATPTLNQINNAAFVTIIPNQFAILFYDGTNWWAVFAPAATVFSQGGTVLFPTAPVNVIVWSAPFACTCTNLLGYTSGSTGSAVNARRNGSLNILASDLVLGSADTWLDGGAVQNAAFSAGDKLEIMLTSVSGLPTEIAVELELTRP